MGAEHGGEDGLDPTGGAGLTRSLALDGWRPMAFGRRPARSIRNPVMEPLWPGRRVLVHVAGSSSGPGSPAPVIHISDEAGLELAGHPDLQAALRRSAQETDLVLDGYLLALPPLGAPLAVKPVDLDVPGVGAATRHLFLGSRRGGRRPTAGTSTLTDLSRVDAAPDGGVLSFVAIDLLALDGESLVDVPLQERKRLLDAVVLVGELVRCTPHVRLPAANWHRQWRTLGFSEMAVKDANSRYYPGESSSDWSIARIPER